MPPPSLGYGKPSEVQIDVVNQWMRSTPWYQQQLRAWGQDPGHPTLTKAQSQYLLHQAQANGVVVDEGDMEVDNHGNFNPKGHKLRNTLLVAGIAGATIATMGAAGVFSGAAGAGAGAGAGGGATAGMFGPMAGGYAGATTAAAVPGALAAVGPTAAAVGTTASTAATVAPRVAGAARFGVNPNVLFTGGSQLFGNLFGAWMQGRAADRALEAETSAARYAADLQSKGQAEALAFSRSQAQNAYDNSEVARRGNYDLYAAGQRRLGFLGEEVGLGSREIPGYVAGVNPHYADGTVGGAANGAPPPDLSGVKAKFDQLFPGETLSPEMLAAHRPELEAMGFTLNPNAAGRITDLSYQGVSIDPIYGAGAGINRKQWNVDTPGSGGGGRSAPTAPPRAPYVAPTVPFLNATPVAPALGYLGSY